MFGPRRSTRRTPTPSPASMCRPSRVAMARGRTAIPGPPVRRRPGRQRRPSRRATKKAKPMRSNTFVLLAMVAAPFVLPAADQPQGPFEPTWESIKAHYQFPQWFRDGKFGIFLHWGLYAVPAHQSEWYVQHMYGNPEIISWHREHFGPQDKFGYKDFIPLFTAAKFDPDQWAELFRKAGARYVMPTAEHHDGFAMWDSALTKWNAKHMGPKRDLVGDLARAVRKHGMKFGVSNHRMEHFTFIRPQAGLATDLYDPQWADFYSVADRSPEARQKFLDDWVARNFELIDKYQPDLIYFDNGVNGRDLDEMLGHKGDLKFTQDAEGLKVTMPAEQPCQYAFTLKITRMAGRAATRQLRPVVTD